MQQSISAHGPYFHAREVPGRTTFTGHFRPLHELNDEHFQFVAYRSESKTKGGCSLALAVASVYLNVSSSYGSVHRNSSMGVWEYGGMGVINLLFLLPLPITHYPVTHYLGPNFAGRFSKNALIPSFASGRAKQ